MILWKKILRRVLRISELYTGELFLLISEQLEGIPMHLFPNRETDPQSERKLVNFICKH